MGPVANDRTWWADVGPDPVPRVRDRAVLQVGALGASVVVVRTRKGVVAFEDRCPHRGRTLADARMVRDQVQCAGHGWRFRIDGGRDGAGGGGLRRWPAIVVDGHLLLAIPATE